MTPAAPDVDRARARPCPYRARDVRADRWMLYRHLSTFAGDGMTHAECRVHDDAGDLLASFTVDAMVRPFAGGAPADDRRALP